MYTFRYQNIGVQNSESFLTHMDFIGFSSSDEDAEKNPALDVVETVENASSPTKVRGNHLHYTIFELKTKCL